MRTHVLWVGLAAVMILIGIGAAGASADEFTAIRTYGVTPFVYGGYSYVPLRSCADYLGATLLWDSRGNQATIIYRSRELTLIVGSRRAYYDRRVIELPVVPVYYGDQLLVPSVVLSQYLEVPVRWEPRRARLLILGPPGWGYYSCLPYTPAYIAPVFQGYGYPVFVPAPFIYSGVTYVPLDSVLAVLGIALLFDAFDDQCEFDYNRTRVVIAIGSRRCYYGGNIIVLSAAPVYVNNVIYVPQDLVARHMRVPFERSGSLLRIRGRQGWNDLRLASAPPAPVSYGHFGRARMMTPAPFTPATRAQAVTIPAIAPPMRPSATERPTGLRGPMGRIGVAPGRPRGVPQMQQPSAPGRGPGGMMGQRPTPQRPSERTAPPEQGRGGFQRAPSGGTRVRPASPERGAPAGRAAPRGGPAGEMRARPGPPQKGGGPPKAEQKGGKSEDKGKSKDKEKGKGD